MTTTPRPAARGLPATRVRALGQAALPAVLVALVFGRILRFGFVYDDRWTLLDNPVLRSPGTLLGLFGAELGRAGVPDAGRPLMLATEILDWALFGPRAAGFHLQSLLWHAGVVTLAQATFRRWGFGGTVAFIAAAVFAVHPLVVEPVAAINYREDLIAAGFSLGALWLAAGAGRGRCLLAALATGLGVLAKESAYVTPLLYLVLTLGPHRPPARQRWVMATALGVPALAGFLWRAWVFGAAGVVSPTAEIPAAHRVLVHAVPRAALAFVSGLGQFVWPARLAPEYPDWTDGRTTTALGLGTLVLCAALVALALRVRRQVPGLAVGWLFAVAAYAPNFGLVPLTNLRADRYFYLATLGWALAAGALLELAIARFAAAAGPGAGDVSGPRLSPPAAFTVIALMAILGLRSMRQLAVWRDDVAVFTAATRSDPRSQRAFVGLAAAELRRGQSLAALAAADAALALADAPRAHEMRGLVLLAQGDPAGAQRELERALVDARGAAYRAEVLTNLGLAELRAGDDPRARAHFEAAEALAPGLDRPSLALAQMSLNAGAVAPARARLLGLLARVPTSFAGWELLAAVAAAAGDGPAAAAAHARARALGAPP